MRTGPRPLSVHIGMAASIWGGGAFAGSMAANGSPDRALRLQAEAAGRLSELLRGIRAYHEHPYIRDLPELPEVWSAGTARLLRAASKTKARGKTQKGSVLLIPSLVNGSAILDLAPDRSLLRWLAGKGFEAHLLDWGEILRDPALATLDGAIGTRLAQALEHLARAGGGPVHVVGYCMGGLLALALAALEPERVRSVTLLASPWEMREGLQPLGDRIKASMAGAFAVIDSLGHLPVDWVQTLFASVDPLMAARKFARFARFAPEAPKARLFVAVEDWLNDGLDLPGEVARVCLKGWYADNDPARGEWRVCGKPIRAREVDCPALVVASGRDRLVPFESAAAAAAQLPRATLLAPDCGHIGMIAGESAIEKVWEPMAAWLARR